MDKKDIAELRKRMTVKHHNIDRVAGCYVNSEGAKINTFSVSSPELEGDEFFRYLEIAKKCLSGKIGNNLMYLGFAPDEEPDGEAYVCIKNALDTGLKDEDVLDSLYERITDALDTPENHLILLFHDVYDVPTKGRDGADQDESDIVFSYILCAVCQVKLPKSALGYVEEEDRIGELRREWTVAMPDTGFMFPSFSERCGDCSHITAYIKNAKEPPVKLWEEGLHVVPVLTSAMKLSLFEKAVSDAEPDADRLHEVMPLIADGIEAYINDRKVMYPEEDDPDIRTDDIRDICTDAGMDEKQAEKAAAGFERSFSEEKDAPAASEILDRGLLKGAELRRKNRALAREVSRLQKAVNGDADALGNTDTVRVTLSQDMQAVAQITDVNGKRCLVIPVNDDTDITVNGSAME